MGVTIKPACEHCGQPYLNGSETTCRTCLRSLSDPDGRLHRVALKCDCGKVAVAVILVKIRVGELINREPLAVCTECLQIERETLKEYL